jgi:hypothetical protein
LETGPAKLEPSLDDQKCVREKDYEHFLKIGVAVRSLQEWGRQVGMTTCFFLEKRGVSPEIVSNGIFFLLILQKKYIFNIFNFPFFNFPFFDYYYQKERGTEMEWSGHPVLCNQNSRPF